MELGSSFAFRDVLDVAPLEQLHDSAPNAFTRLRAEWHSGRRRGCISDSCSALAEDGEKGEGGRSILVRPKGAAGSGRNDVSPRAAVRVGLPRIRSDPSGQRDSPRKSFRYGLRHAGRAARSNEHAGTALIRRCVLAASPRSADDRS